MQNNYLFKVQYQGASNNHFVNGNIYKVLEIDKDGDYLILDEFLNIINEYKSKFIIYKEFRKED